MHSNVYQNTTITYVEGLFYHRLVGDHVKIGSCQVKQSIQVVQTVDTN